MSSYDQFLRTSLTKYKNPDITKRDVACVFTSFSDLRPKMEKFVFNDGTVQALLQLDGTIRVTYKGSVYNIPVCIWLVDTHPYNAPMVYVRPTAVMSIKIGRNVDCNGKVHLPYLNEWRYPNSDLLGLLQILSIVFGEDPPVYSKTKVVDNRPRDADQTSLKSPYPRQSANGSSAQGNGSYPSYGYPPSVTTQASPYYPCTGTPVLPYPGTVTRTPLSVTQSPYYPPTSTTDVAGSSAKSVTIANLKDLKYDDPEMTCQEITNLLCVFRSLKPETTTLMLPPRQLKKVVQLSGNIPVSYGGTICDVPISITVMLDFPECAPMVYVTTEVTRESGSVVDDTGLVDIPYIKDWLYPRSNLVGMAHSLCIAFGENFPVSPSVVDSLNASDEVTD